MDGLILGGRLLSVMERLFLRDLLQGSRKIGVGKQELIRLKGLILKSQNHLKFVKFKKKLSQDVH